MSSSKLDDCGIIVEEMKETLTSKLEKKCQCRKVACYRTLDLNRNPPLEHFQCAIETCYFLEFDDKDDQINIDNELVVEYLRYCETNPLPNEEKFTKKDYEELIEHFDYVIVSECDYAVYEQ